jgi:hypothetical protein
MSFSYGSDDFKTTSFTCFFFKLIYTIGKMSVCNDLEFLVQVTIHNTLLYEKYGTHSLNVPFSLVINVHLTIYASLETWKGTGIVEVNSFSDLELELVFYE